MATDFGNNGRAISAGPFKTSIINAPLNAKYRVNAYEDIQSIPYPAVGELIYVISDETRNYRSSLYIINSLTSNQFGLENMKVGEVVLFDDFIEEVKSASTIDGKSIWCGTEEEYNVITENGEKEDKDTIYMIEDASVTVGPRGPRGLMGPTGPTGPRGDVGRTGRDGININILGMYETEEELKLDHKFNNSNGDCYLVNRDMYIWLNSNFINFGPVTTAISNTNILLGNKEYIADKNNFIKLPSNVQNGILILDNDGKILNDMLPDNISVVLTSPNGKKFKIIVDDYGNLSTKDIN